MRGRTLFHLSQPALVGAAAALKLLPYGLCSLGMTLARHIPTRLGIALRYVLLRRLAKGCGDNVAIFEGVYLHHLDNAEFGDNVSIHPMCYLNANGGIHIGSDVSIAHGTTIMAEEHDYSQPGVPIKDTPGVFKPVIVGSDVWIGAGVKVLAGVTVGDHVVIGAGSVVTGDLPAHTLAVGVPARPLKSLRDEAG
jgi:acetyltransferase-like isoleucine patch superfamily enzyme